jgi:hypothetical protein
MVARLMSAVQLRNGNLTLTSISMFFGHARSLAVQMPRGGGVAVTVYWWRAH